MNEARSAEAATPLILLPLLPTDSMSSLAMYVHGTEFSGAGFHAGQTCMWSDGCPIVGGDFAPGLVRVRNEVYEDEGEDGIQIGDTIEVHHFHYADTVLKAQEMFDYVDCVRRHIKKTPDISLRSE